MSSVDTPTTASTRLRQIALITKDIERAEHLLTTVLGTEVVFVDPQVAKWGLKNILVAVGGDIIEVCAPFRPDTTVGRLLHKRGDGGYMIIMQTGDAAARRKFVESQNLTKVIYGYEHDDCVCVQYHPKGIAGGMMPELDSHTVSPSNPTPLESTYSPWHACGPDFERYSTAMKRCSHMRLQSATCRLAPGQQDTGAAVAQWQKYFGVRGEGSELHFTNSRLKFVPGVKGQPEGLDSITIEVAGRERYTRMLDVARKEGVYGDGSVKMLGVRWYIVLNEGGVESPKSKL